MIGSTLAPPVSLDSRLARTAGPERKGRDGPEAEGDEGDRAQEARSVGELIATKSGLDVCYVDERMSTSRALRAVREIGGRIRGRKQDVDSLAATVILQRYLEQTP